MIFIIFNTFSVHDSIIQMIQSLLNFEKKFCMLRDNQLIVRKIF